MVRKNLKAAVLAFIVAVLFTASATAVYASATVDGQMGYYGPYLGYSYENQASVYASDPGYGVFAGTHVANQVNVNIPTGYMGAKARLYDSNGILDTSSSWYYNSAPQVGMLVLSPYYYSSGIYYSYGLTAAYNGSGYSTYYTFQSPNVNYTN